MEEVTEQIDEMLKMYDVEGTVEDISEEEVVEEVIDDQIKEIQEEKTEESTPIKEAEDSFTVLKREHDELKLKLDEIMSRKIEPEVVVKSNEPEIITELDFIENEDLDDVINDTKKFNALLNKVYLKGIEAANKKHEELRSKLPETIRETVTVTESIRKKSEEFYSVNTDLAQFKGAVATVFNELAQQNPTYDYDKLLTLTEVETRKRLNLTKPTELNGKKDVPSLPRKRSQQRSTPPTKSSNPLIDDIDAMNDVLYR